MLPTLSVNLYLRPGELCTQAPGNLALVYHPPCWPIASACPGRRSIRVSCHLGWLPLLFVISRWSFDGSTVTASLSRVPAAHGAGAWHRLSLTLRASLYSTLCDPNLTGEEIEVVRGEFAFCVARLQNLYSLFPPRQRGLVWNTCRHGALLRLW